MMVVNDEFYHTKPLEPEYFTCHGYDLTLQILSCFIYCHAIKLFRSFLVLDTTYVTIPILYPLYDAPE